MSTYSLEALRRTEDPKWVREIVTPEGIPIRFTLARGAERAGAFILDCCSSSFLSSSRCC
jgi:hypothetical protein